MDTPFHAPHSALLAILLLCVAAPARAQDPAPAAGPPPAQAGADPSDDAFRMGSPPALAEGLSEEEMWPAATAEGWAEPVLVRWQRTFDDAMRVARVENRPVLVAVNMDGEIASEHFAGVRYRDLDTAEMMARYVCVIASVYRHTPRDYDEEGRRVTCPRFGTVTCSEHIEAERELYEKYFDGRRISPRHIVLDLEGTETLDVYYSWDTATVFTTFRKGVEGWPEPIESPEPTLTNLVQSARVEDREWVERRYVEGDREARRAILEALLEQRVVDQVEVLRAALFGLDLELASTARRALAECDTEGALDLMAETLKTPLAPAERELLLAAVTRLAEGSPRARTLAALHSGLSQGSPHIDPTTVESLVREYEANSISLQSRAAAAAERVGDPMAALELAEALLERAQVSTEPRWARLLYEDARSAAAAAERLGAAGPRLDALQAVVAAELGDRTTAWARSVAAVEGGLLGEQADAPEGERSVTLTPASRTRVLELFADARKRAIRNAYRAGNAWPPEWLSDVNAAYASLAEDPLADSATPLEHYDFLRWIGATRRAEAVLRAALRRHPDSSDLHERLRGWLLWSGGPEELERGYTERLAREESADTAASQLTWFAGYASLVAAEHHRRRGEFEAALAAYDRASAHYEHNIERFPDGRDTCDHFIALGHAGRARLALERGDLVAGTQALLAGLRRRPDSAASPDGLNITPIATAKMLKAKLLEAGDQEGAARVQAALDALDPKLLEPPPSELPGTRRGGRRGRSRDAGGR